LQKYLKIHGWTKFYILAYSKTKYYSAPSRPNVRC